MKDRTLLITPEVQDQIQSVIEYAERNRFTLDEMTHRYEMARSGREPAAVGEDDDHVVIVSSGDAIVYSIEEHPEPLGWCRHLSVSNDSEKEPPSVESVGRLLRLFGFKLTVMELAKQGLHYSEQVGVKNFLEPLNLDALRPDITEG